MLRFHESSSGSVICVLNDDTNDTKANSFCTYQRCRINHNNMTDLVRVRALRGPGIAEYYFINIDI